MKKIINKTVIFWLSIIVALCSINVGNLFVVRVTAADSSNEQKVYCNATLEDNFAPDTVLVVMSNKSSLACKTYTQSDFSEIAPKNVRHMALSYEADVREAVNNIATSVSRGSEVIISNDIDLAVDIFAPGTNINTTITGGGLGTGNQTSMATPLVTGTAALLLSIDSTLDSATIKQIIIDSADECIDLASYCEDGRRLNVEEAIDLGKYYYDHTNHDTNYIKSATTHTLYCIDCEYSSDEEYHKFYIYSDYGEDGCTVRCYVCNYTIECDEAAEYYGTDASGHSVSCPSGEFSFFEAHSYTYPAYTSAGHTATCSDCGYSHTENHTWTQSGTMYRCTLCGALSTGDFVNTTPPEDEDLNE